MYLLLPLQLPHQLPRPRLLLLPQPHLRLHLSLPLPLHVLPYSTQRCSEVFLVTPYDDLQLADRPRLFRDPLVLRALWRVGGELGAREERSFEGEDLVGARVELAARGEKFLLELWGMGVSKTYVLTCLCVL